MKGPFGWVDQRQVRWADEKCLAFPVSVELFHSSNEALTESVKLVCRFGNLCKAFCKRVWPIMIGAQKRIKHPFEKPRPGICGTKDSD